MKPRVAWALMGVLLVAGGLFAWAVIEPWPEGVAAPAFSPFDELHDAYEWAVSHVHHIAIPLPHSGSSHIDADHDEIIIFRGITKFMLLELLAAGLTALVYIPLARRIRTGAPPRRAWDNCFDAVLTSLRDHLPTPNLA